MNAPIISEFVELRREGETLPAFYAAPRECTPTTPAIVMAMHLFGIDSGQRDVAQRLAGAGFATLIPDLYARFNAPNGEGATDHARFVPFARQLTFQSVDPDIRAAANWLRERSPAAKIGILGFCMGGTIAINRTTGYADTFAAAAVWYGFNPKLDPATVDIPIVASYGGNDHGIPIEQVESFRAGLRVVNDFKVYPNASHAFFDRREAYDAAAADDSWARSLAFLGKHLRPER